MKTPSQNTHSKNTSDEDTLQKHSNSKISDEDALLKNSTQKIGDEDAFPKHSQLKKLAITVQKNGDAKLAGERDRVKAAPDFPYYYFFFYDPIAKNTYPLQDAEQQKSCL